MAQIEKYSLLLYNLAENHLRNKNRSMRLTLLRASWVSARRNVLVQAKAAYFIYIYNE